VQAISLFELILFQDNQRTPRVSSVETVRIAARHSSARRRYYSALACVTVLASFARYMANVIDDDTFPAFEFHISVCPIDDPGTAPRECPMGH
jgi:hypothetical protein